MINRRALIAGCFALNALPVRAQGAKLPVIASFSILGDLVAQIGGTRVSVTTLVGPEGDAHVWQPAPTDAARVASAKLFVTNGLGFEGWVTRLIGASGAKPAILVASQGVTPLREGSAIDPHAWQSIANARCYIENIRDGLSRADPPGASAYAANAKAYLAQLDAVESDVGAAIARIPAARRRLVTTHDAFGYFAKAYGLDFLAAVGVSTEAEISAKDVAKIIKQVRADKVPAVFLENIGDPRLMQRIASETGAKIGGRLYSDALSQPDGPAGTYIAMMRYNIRELEKALAN